VCGASHKGEAKGKLLEVPSTKAAYKKNAGVFLPPLPSKSLTRSGKINAEKLDCFATIKGLTLCSKVALYGQRDSWCLELHWHHLPGVINIISFTSKN